MPEHRRRVVITGMGVLSPLGNSVDEMWRLVKRCDLVIVSTDVNSHTAVMVARKVARNEGKEVLMTRSGSPSRFREMLRALPKAA